jgi:hypothetical protein
VTAFREKLCSGEGGKKEGEASGLVTLEGVEDEEMLDRQGCMSESNRNPDLMKGGALSHVLLISNKHIIKMKGQL